MSDVFIKIDGVDGESKDDSHEGEIDVIAWNWSLSQAGTFHHGGGGGAGKVAVGNLTFTHKADLASPTLMLFCARGEHISEATLTVRKAGTDPLEYVVFKMTKCMVTDIVTTQNGNDVVEDVTLNFAMAEYKYTSQADEGGADTEKIFAWDIEKNVQA